MATKPVAKVPEVPGANQPTTPAEVKAEVRQATKPGYTTTEFYVTVLTNVGALVALLHPGFEVTKFVQPAAMIAAALANAVYTQSRSKVKAAHP